MTICMMHAVRVFYFIILFSLPLPLPPTNLSFTPDDRICACPAVDRVLSLSSAEDVVACAEQSRVRST